MGPQRFILVVAQSQAIADAVVSSLGSAHNVVVVSTFARARFHLDLCPVLLVTELRLGEYNGLHLALRGRSNGVPSIVIGAPDPVLENEAAKLGATYLTTTKSVREQLPSAVDELLQDATLRAMPTVAAIAWVDQSQWHAGEMPAGRSARKPSHLYH